MPDVHNKIQLNFWGLARGGSRIYWKNIKQIPTTLNLPIYNPNEQDMPRIDSFRFLWIIFGDLN